MSLEDLDDYEVAIYLMEHNDVDAVTVCVTPDDSLDISGRVFLMGKPQDFSIKWSRES